MLGFFKKAITPEKNTLTTAISAGAHKHGVLVCGDPGHGSSLVSQLIVKEITKEKIKSKFLVVCHSAEDFSHLIKTKKITTFVIKEENLDFKFPILTLNSLKIPSQKVNTQMFILHLVEHFHGKMKLYLLRQTPLRQHFIVFGII